MANDCPHRDVLGTTRPDGSTAYHCLNCNMDLGAVNRPTVEGRLIAIALLLAAMIAFAGFALIRWLI